MESPKPSDQAPRWRLSASPALPGRIGSVLVALFGAWLGVGALFEELDGARRFHAGASLAQGSLSAPERGPRRYEGLLRGPERTAPSGAPAAFWVGWVTADKHKQLTQEVCRVGEADGLVLEVDEQRVPFELPPERVWLTYATPHYEPGSIPVDVEVTRSAGGVPPAFAARCEGLANFASWKLTYHEAKLEDGARAVVSACHDGAKLASCEGGQSFVAVRGATALLVNLRDAVALNVTMALVVCVMALFGAGLWALQRPSS
jgi:hypothetical protein